MYLHQEYAQLERIFDSRPVICTSIRTNDPVEYLNHVRRAREKGSDMAELRLDFFNTITPKEVRHIISESELPLIVSNRNKENGGYFSKGEESRLSLIISAMDAKPAFVDIELTANDVDRTNVIGLAKENRVGIICSYHDFKSTPSDSDILEFYRKMSEAGADLNKLVFTPHTGKHVRTILLTNNLLNSKSIPYTLFGMGKIGYNSRLISLLLGSCLIYCSLDNKSDNKLYQLSLEDTKYFFEVIENRGWKYMREKKNDVLALSLIEYNDDNTYVLKSIDSIIA